MKPGLSHIVVALDKSGSMQEVRDDAIGGFNRFLEDQQKEPGQATITLVLFDHLYHCVLDFVDLKQAEPLNATTYAPNGNTALLDAIGRTIDDVGKKLAALPEDDRPEKVVFAILTDGMENSSSDYTRDRVKKMIQHQTEAYKWEFIYLAANVDAFATGAGMGINPRSTRSFASNPQGTRGAFDQISQVVSVSRRRN